MGGNEDDDKSDGWAWNEKQLQSLKAEHDKFFHDLRDEGRRLERHLAGSVDHRNDAHHTGSPFSAFTTFVDSLAASIVRFPSNVAEFRRRMQEDDERRGEEQQDMSRRWTGSDKPRHEITSQQSQITPEEKEAARDATHSLLYQAWKRNASVPLPKIQALYHDHEIDGFSNTTVSSLGAFTQHFTGAPTRGGPVWLSVEWFKGSPYSPIRLEAHPDLAASGAKWRAAFEDLMSAALDKPMQSKEYVGERSPFGKPQSTYHGPGLEWMLSLQCRGVLPPLLPHFYSSPASWSQVSHNGHLLPAELIRVPADARQKTKCYPGGPETGITADILDLLAEVETKATADTEADPLRHLEQPDTEQDLYDSPYIFLPTPAAEALKKGDIDVMREKQMMLARFKQQNDEESKRQESKLAEQGLHPFGFEVKHLNSPDAEEDLMNALMGGDVKQAADILSKWYKRNGDVWELCEELVNELHETSPTEPTSEWFPVLNAALRQSDLPDTNDHKAEAYSKTTKLMEKLDAESLKDKRRRRDLMRHAEAITGGGIGFDRYLSIPELEEYVEGLDEQLANLLKMTGGHKKRAPTEVDHGKNADAVAVKKPDILSALTTTQTIRLPDGTVTTKVVLKQRFADGREETTESVHTTHESVEQQQREAQDEQPKKKGWFWS